MDKDIGREAAELEDVKVDEEAMHARFEDSMKQYGRSYNSDEEKARRSCRSGDFPWEEFFAERKALIAEGRFAVSPNAHGKGPNAHGKSIAVTAKPSRQKNLSAKGFLPGARTEVSMSQLKGSWQRCHVCREPRDRLTAKEACLPK
ncbi:hypothetical protein HU200_014568 [Digitaria exilis]|uniref:Uncharacterized protein n=1 Tax=Digitaria exilis TaxID=1010633 RepID=A0A835FB51_9POAL|nr:hypothetical protein HU200_014568 [Digitaria exilis]